MPSADSDLLQRRGKFEISLDVFRDEPEALLKAFLSDCLVVRCELRYDTNSFHYTALCRHFEVCPREYVAPRYNILFKRVNVGTEEKPEYETQLDHVERLS
jgi:hypothetical protein